MQLPLWFEFGSMVVLGLILIVDLVLVIRRPHEPSLREASIWVSVYVALAICFAGVLWLLGDGEHAGQFVAGWITEYSLSVDNLFVFILIMGRFAVPRAYQQAVLMVGIVIALVLRGVFIVVGVGLIDRFGWLFYLFGIFLIVTALRQLLRSDGEDEQTGDGAVTRWAKRHLAYSPTFDGARLRTTVDSRRVFTPMLLVLVALGSTDLVFALDSIPAIFGITTNAFLVFSANVFALMGLRQLYFVLGGLLKKLIYLSHGVVAILLFIGVKMVVDALAHNEVPFINGGRPVPHLGDVPTWVSLCVILGILVVATVASLVREASRSQK